LSAARTDVPFSLVDLEPTLRELLALDPPPDAERSRGQSKLAALRGAPTAPSPIYCEKVEGAALDGAVQIKAARIGSWKLIQRYASRRGADGARRETVVVGEELYDLALDPLEAWDLSNAPPGAAPLASLRRELARFVSLDGDLAALGELLAARRKGLIADDPETA
jgi:arylsulfatase A-like enzyme